MVKKALFLLIGVLIISLFINAINPESSEPDIILANIENVKLTDSLEDKPLRIALGTGISPESNIEYYWTLVKLIEERIGRKVEVIQRKSYAEINYLLTLNLVDVALICSSSYVLAAEDAKLDLLAIPKIDGEYEYQSYTIVKNDSTYMELYDLKGKSFAFSDPMSTTGFYYPAFRLSQLSSTPDEFFSSFFFSYSHDNSIQAVINGLADAASVDSTVFNKVLKSDPDLMQKVRIIEKSPKFLNSPIVVRADLDGRTKKSLENLFLSIDKDEDVKKVFEQYGIEGYRQESNPKAGYEPVRKMINEVRQKK